MLNLLRRHDQPLAPPTLVYVQVTFSSTTGNCLLAFVYGLTGLFFALACLLSSFEKMIGLSTLEHQALLPEDLTLQPIERYVMSYHHAGLCRDQYCNFMGIVSLKDLCSKSGT